MDLIAWLLLTFVGIVGAIWTILERARKNTPRPPDKSEVEQAAEEKAKKDEQDVSKKRDEAVKEARQEAEAIRSKVVEDLEKNKDRLLNDNDALTKYLKNVGKDVRGRGD